MSKIREVMDFENYNKIFRGGMVKTGRGQLTEKAQEIAKKMLGREISESELRLLPYIQFTMMNEQKLDIRKISPEERKILKRWKEEEHIEGGSCGLAITKEFWDFMNEILFECYVDIE